MGRRYELTLPWPPSVNRYWRTPKGGSRPLISADGRKYREKVRALLRVESLPPLNECELEVEIEAWPPDRRRRDIDNLLKATLDALEHGGLYADDNQIARLAIERKDVVAGGQMIVVVMER